MSAIRFMCYVGCKTVQKMYVDEIPNEPESISVSKIATYNCPKCGMAYDKAFIDDYIAREPNDFMLYRLGKQVARIHARIDAEKSREKERDAIFKKAGEHLFAQWIEKHGYSKKGRQMSDTPRTDAWLNGQMALIETNQDFEKDKIGLICQGFGLHDGARFARKLESELAQKESALIEAVKWIQRLRDEVANLKAQVEQADAAYANARDELKANGIL